MDAGKRTVTLNTGAKMPTLGMGTWHHGPREEIDAALRQDLSNWNSKRASTSEGGGGVMEKQT